MSEDLLFSSFSNSLNIIKLAMYLRFGTLLFMVRDGKTVYFILDARQ